MKIGVLSDTHIPRIAPDLPNKVYKILADVDLILHSGDFVEMILLNKLKEIAKVIAVSGNMDSRILKKELPKKIIIKEQGYKIGLTHGYGIPSKTIKNVKLEFEKEDLDLIVFGHTHYPYNQVIGNTIYFNPGSVTDKVFSPYNSFGIIHLKDRIYAEIIRLNE